MKNLIFLLFLSLSLSGVSLEASQKNGLVLPVEKLVWKMIEGSEGISSCTIPSYDLTRSMEILNATFLKMSAQMQQYQGMPGKYKKQAMAQAEAEINGQKAVLGKVLNNVIKYCI